MKQKDPQRKRLAFIVAGIVLLLSLGAFWGLYSAPPNVDALYAAAVKDAVTAEWEELEPLVELTPSDPMTTWDDQGRVLLLSWNDQPAQYLKGAEIALSGSEIWTFTDREIAVWYAENNDAVTDWNLRLEQLIGLPPDAGYTHVSGFWVEISDILRPAYVTDVTKQMQISFPDGVDPAFQAWFEDNSVFSYEESAYPWTRLGYTYDWADNGKEYGLSEFLIKKGASVQVAFTETTTDFLAWLEQDAPLDAMI